MKTLLGKGEPRVPLHASDAAADAVDEIVASARILVRSGYLGAEEIASHLLDIASDTGLDDTLFDAMSLVDHEIRELRAEQMHWPAMTDWDRLDAALEGLELKGIVARQDFLCCGSCGQAAIWDEIREFEEPGRRARGYVFFHQQDTESAVEGHGLYFNYDSASEAYDEREAIRIGRELVSALESAGLSPQWDGDIAKRIHLPMDWKRRWPGG